MADLDEGTHASRTGRTGSSLTEARSIYMGIFFSCPAGRRRMQPTTRSI